MAREARPLGDPAKYWWTMDDIAVHWGIKPKTVRTYRTRARGELPPEDDKVGQTPVWAPATILGFRRPGKGTRTDLQDPTSRKAQPMNATDTPTRVTVRVMLNFGDDAELITPDHDAEAPLRVPAADIARDAGLPANELPGREFTAVRDGDTFRDFELVHDPRL